VTVTGRRQRIRRNRVSDHALRPWQKKGQGWSVQSDRERSSTSRRTLVLRMPAWRGFLDALRTAGVEAPNLLTAQTGSSETRDSRFCERTGSIAWSSIGPLVSEAVVLQVAKVGGSDYPRLKVNDEPVPWEALQSTLRVLFQNRRDRVSSPQSRTDIAIRGRRDGAADMWPFDRKPKSFLVTPPQIKTDQAPLSTFLRQNEC